MERNYYRFKSIEEFRVARGIDDGFLHEGYKHVLLGHHKEDQQDILKENPKVLYIDGITSAGKTTLLNNLSKTLPDAKFIPEFTIEIPENYRNIGPDMSLADQLRAEFWFYQQYRAKDTEIRQHSGKLVVDRGLLGLFCYSNLLGEKNEVSSRILWRATQRSWVQGLYVFLTASPEVVKQRLLTRKDQATIIEEDWSRGLSDFIEILHRSVENLSQAAGIHLIDTSEKTTDQVLVEVSTLYTEYCEKR